MMQISENLYLLHSLFNLKINEQLVSFIYIVLKISQRLNI